MTTMNSQYNCESTTTLGFNISTKFLRFSSKPKKSAAESQTTNKSRRKSRRKNLLLRNCKHESVNVRIVQIKRSVMTSKVMRKLFRDWKMEKKTNMRVIWPQTLSMCLHHPNEGENHMIKRKKRNRASCHKNLLLMPKSR